MGNICTSCRGAEVSITPRVTAEAPRDPPQDPPTDTGNISPSQYPADISPSLPPADGWLVPNVQLDEKALIELSIAIESRIVSVRGGAAAALGHLEIMRATASSGADADATRAIDARVAALAEEVALAEAAKVASLEAELVQADEALERLQAGNTSSDSLRVLFGPGALFPMEPSALRLEPSATPGEIATLFAPRCVGGQIFHVRRRIVPSDLVDIPEFCVLAVTPEVLHVLTVEHEHAVSLRDPVSWAHTPTTLTLVAMTAAREWRAVVFDTALGGEVAEAIEGFYAPAGYDQIDPFRERRAREISAITRLDAVTLEGDEASAVVHAGHTRHTASNHTKPALTFCAAGVVYRQRTMVVTVENVRGLHTRIEQAVGCRTAPGAHQERNTP